jgi:serine/threonine-protein kinase
MGDDPTALLGGRYRLLSRIGEGGFGAVYRAADKKLKRDVAIKVLDPMKEARSADHATTLQERFRREAIATAQIDHPNVVTVYDIGIDEDQVYIVMELLEGRPLSEELAHWPTGIEASRTLPLFAAALRGLQAGHDVGVVHKDLKPANLFLTAPGTPDERLRLIDFGVARVVHEQKLTVTGKIVGTPRYLAPEYIDQLEVTPAVDIYQMGLILVEMLSSFPCMPRRLDLVTCCQRHLDGELKIPNGLRYGDIGKAIARATAIDPKDRFASVAEFADALEAVDPKTVHPEAGDRRSTPRLGILPLNKDTQPMYGGREAAPDEAEPEPQQTKRHLPTGPTKRLGSMDVISGRLAAMEAAPATDTFGTEVLDDPLRSTRLMIYGLIAVAALLALGTALFFVIAKN